jgi:hypothetical protein
MSVTTDYTTLYPGREDSSIMHFLFKNESVPASIKCILYKTLIRLVTNYAYPTWAAAEPFSAVVETVKGAHCMCHSKHLACIIT